MVTVTITAKFHNPSLSRRKEWQHATRLYRDTKQFCIDGWENGEFDKSVTTASISNDLYSAIQKPFERRNPTTTRTVRFSTERANPSPSTTRTGRLTRQTMDQLSSGSHASLNGGTRR